MRIFHRPAAVPGNAGRESLVASVTVPVILPLALLLGIFNLVSCSVPNLEPPDCTAARTPVREFYSFHFGNDMTFSADNLEKRKEYLTPEFYETLRQGAPAGDPFTRTDDLPKAFRVGACRAADGRVQYDVLLFWKTDTRTEQRTIRVDAANIDGRWLVSGVGD